MPIALLLLAALTAANPAADDAEAIRALGEVRMVMKRNAQGNVDFIACAGCKKRPIVARDLALLKELPELATLNLQAFAEFSNEDLPLITGLTQLKTLRLPMSSKITDSGIAHFSKLKQLKILDLRTSKISSQGLATLREALPGTEIRLREAAQ